MAKLARKDGFFRFVHIPPGEYLVLVNPDDSQTADFPFRRTFHPGVHDRSAATVITVRAGEQIKDADIWLQQQFVHVTSAFASEWVALVSVSPVTSDDALK